MKQVRHDHKLVKAAQKNQLEDAKAILIVTGGKKSLVGLSAASSSKKKSGSMDSLLMDNKNLLDVDTPEKLTHVDVNCRDDENGYTPLMYAVSNGNVDLATILIHFSADVDIQDHKGNSPLHLAVFNSQSKLVQILLGKRAKVNLSNQDGNTPLHIACQHYGIGDKFLLIKLLQVKPDLRAKNKAGATPLDLAAQYDKQEAVSILLDHEPCLNSSGRAFREAAVRGHVGVLQLMLDYGVDPNVADSETGTTALHEACRYLRYDAAKLLLSYGADPQNSNANDETPQAVLSAYPGAKIGRFLQLFQDGGSLPRLRPKYTEANQAAELNRCSYHSSGGSSIDKLADHLDDRRSGPRLSYLKWSVPPVQKAFVDVTMPEFAVEGDSEMEDDLELLVEEALVTGDNIYKLVPQGAGKPATAVFSDIAMLRDGIYTLTVRSVADPSIGVSAVVTVANQVMDPSDVDAAFDRLEKMLQLDF